MLMRSSDREKNTNIMKDKKVRRFRKVSLERNLYIYVKVELNLISHKTPLNSIKYIYVLNCLESEILHKLAWTNVAIIWFAMAELIRPQVDRRQSLFWQDRADSTEIWYGSGTSTAVPAYFVSPGKLTAGAKGV